MIEGCNVYAFKFQDRNKAAKYWRDTALGRILGSEYGSGSRGSFVQPVILSGDPYLSRSILLAECSCSHKAQGGCMAASFREDV